MGWPARSEQLRAFPRVVFADECSGQIIALSKYFRAPIHVLQAGTDIVKTGEDLPPGRGPILLSCVSAVGTLVLTVR